MKKVCIFVDGENFRFSINKLFENNNSQYLPMTDWNHFFDFLVDNLKEKYQFIDNPERLRTYWYVVNDLDFIPYKNLTEEQNQNKEKLQNRFQGWQRIQDGISTKHNNIEFRRSGSISYLLDRNTFSKEKAVDVNLAVDLLKLRDIYDIAILVSGDQDYAPVVNEIKNFGKIVVNAVFKKKSGSLELGDLINALIQA